MTQEEKIRKRIKALQRFYMDGVTFAIVNAILILIWLILDRNGAFWPKYVIVVCGITLIFKGYSMGVMPIFLQHIPFMNPEWEEKKIKELKSRRHDQWKIPLNRNLKK